MKYGSKIHFQKMLKKESHAKIGNILQFKLRIKIKIFPTYRKKSNDATSGWNYPCAIT